MAEEMNQMGMTPYETIKVAHMNNRGDRAVGIVGLVVAGVGAVAGVTGWIYANSQAKRAQEVAAAKNDATQKQLELLTNLLSAERNERIAGDRTLSISINDTVSGQQQTTQSQSTVQSVEQSLFKDAVMGNLRQAPVEVVRVSGQRQCGCDDGCGCNQ